MKMNWKDLLIFIIAYFLGGFIAGFAAPLIPSNMPFAAVLLLVLPPTCIWLVLRKLFHKSV